MLLWECRLIQLVEGNKTVSQVFKRHTFQLRHSIDISRILSRGNKGLGKDQTKNNYVLEKLKAGGGGGGHKNTYPNTQILVCH